MEEHLAFIGLNIEKICSLEMRDRRPDQGIIDKLYRRAWEKYGVPPTMLAAERLVSEVSEGDTVIIATGAGTPPYLPKGETDGPLGGAAVARALRYGLDAVPVVICQPAHVENISATCAAAGLAVHDYETAKEVPFSCTVEAFPGDDTAPEVAEEIMRRMEPQALIAIEKLGPNEVGVAHTSTGGRASPNRARAEHLFDLAKGAGVLTIGIGDNGNEIGFGSIADAVREHKQWGDVCQCPCGQGIADATETDVIIVSGVSNWGGYGLEACLAAIIERPELIHDVDTERRMLEECVRTGGLDGATTQQTLSVDGTPAFVQTAVLDLMRVVVARGIRPERKRAY